MEVTIITRFNLGDTIYFLSEVTSRIIEAKVREVIFYIERGKNTIYYKTEPYSMVREDKCFASREEIIKSLNN